MALFAIGDLHLSFASDKPMDIFGDQWQNHTEKVKEMWLKYIKEEDTVLIPGDISWALKLEDALLDLDWLADLPGRKIIGKGNHDYWWHGINKLNAIYSNMFFLQNSYYSYEEYAICGTRGWISPNSNNYTEHDEKIYLRELNRLKISLDKAKKDGKSKIIAMMHYPPTNEKYESSGFTDLFETYGVEKVIYAHLHGKNYYQMGFQGIRNNIEYLLVSCDYLEFEPLKIL